MNPTTQLALMTKAKRVFERDGTFLSFPVLSPLTYPPEKLRFVGSGVDLRTLGEFSRLVNTIPRGTLFPQVEESYLWDVYVGLFRSAEVAAGAPTEAQSAAYKRAAAVLYVTTPDGLRQDSATFLAFKQHRDAWIAALEEYKAGQVTSETSTDAAVKARWRSTEEPALREKLAQAEARWASAGFRAKVEDAERVVREFDERPSSVRQWDEWRESFNPDIDAMTESPPSNQSFAPTAFSPANPFDDGWPTFTLSADEVAGLVADAPPELKEVLDLGGSGPPLDKVSFQFRSVGLTRPWLRPEAFRAKFWRFPASEPPLSDGASPPQGTCPAYVTGVVFAREIVEATRQSGGAVDLLPIMALPMMAIRPERRVQPPVVPLVIGVRPGIRHAGPFAGAMARLGARIPAAEAVGVAHAAVRPAVRDHRGLVAPAAVAPRSFSPLERLSRGAFLIQPARVAPIGVPPAAPPAPPPPSVPTNVITILAFICRWLPKSPDPDPSLTWTD